MTEGDRLFLEEANRRRAALGRPPLTVSPELYALAERRAREWCEWKAAHPRAYDRLRRADARQRARADLAKIISAALEVIGIRPWPPAIVEPAPIPLRTAHAGQRAPRSSPGPSRQVKSLDRADEPPGRSHLRILEVAAA